MRLAANGEVIVSAPSSTPLFLIERFLAEQQQWILNSRAKQSALGERLTGQTTDLFWRGRTLPLRISVGSGQSGVTLEKGRLLVRSVSEDHQLVRTLLEKWYQQAAKIYFSQRVPLLADVVGRGVSKVTIRSSRTRWGSCSSASTIALNWRLIQAPDWVSDYVIYHELAHLVHLNHSPAFWRLVGGWFPRHPEARQWLKEHHDLLHF